MSNEFNGDSNEYNRGVPESASYSELHSTAELHSTSETHSYSEFGDTGKRTAPPKTLVTSRGMNEALQYSSQVAAVIKAVAVVSVVAVVAIIPILDEGSDIQLEFLKYGSEDTYIYYYIEVMDYDEDMDLTVSVHNDFVNRTKAIESGFVDGYEDGLQPNMEYKITVKSGWRTIAEKTVWTKKEASKPDFQMHFCQYSAVDESFHFLFDVNNDEYHDFSVTLEYSDKVIGSADPVEPMATQTVAVTGLSMENVYVYTTTFHLWCKITSEGMEVPVELYYQTFEVYKAPHIELTDKPIFNRSAHTLTLNYDLEDPNNQVNPTDGIKVVVECPALGTDVFDMYDRDETAAVIKIPSSFTGYDSKVSIYALGETETLLYRATVPLYYDDSVIAINGIHLDGTDRNTLYFDMDYLDDDNVFSDITLDVDRNGSKLYSTISIIDLATNPHIDLSDIDVDTTSDVFDFTVNYKRHGPSDTSMDPQPTLAFSGLSVPYVEPMFKGMVTGYPERSSSGYVSVYPIVSDLDGNWSDYRLSVYWRAKDSSVYNPIMEDKPFSGMNTSSTIDISSASVPDYNAAIYLSVTATETQLGGSTTDAVVFQDLVVPTVFIEFVTVDTSSTNKFEFNVTELLGVSAADTLDIDVEWTDGSYDYHYSGSTVGTGLASVSVDDATAINPDYGQAYLTITDSGTTLIDGVVIPGFVIPQG